MWRVSGRSCSRTRVVGFGVEGCIGFKDLGLYGLNSHSQPARVSFLALGITELPSSRISQLPKVPFSHLYMRRAQWDSELL